MGLSILEGHKGDDNPRAMRPVGSNRLDSTVQHLGEEGLPEEFSKRHEAISGREGPAMPGDEDFSEGANGVMEVEYDNGDGDISRAAEVSVGCFCCSKLSPTFIVYMSAFVSSLTSVLLGYGEWPKRNVAAFRSSTPSCSSCVFDSLVEDSLDALATVSKGKLFPKFPRVLRMMSPTGRLTPIPEVARVGRRYTWITLQRNPGTSQIGRAHV